MGLCRGMENCEIGMRDRLVCIHHRTPLGIDHRIRIVSLHLDNLPFSKTKDGRTGVGVSLHLMRLRPARDSGSLPGLREHFNGESMKNKKSGRPDVSRGRHVVPLCPRKNTASHESAEAPVLSSLLICREKDAGVLIT